MSTSFLKKRNNLVFIVDPSSNICAVFMFPYRGWYRDNFKASMKSAWASGFPLDEISQMPIWYGKGGGTITGMEIYAVTGYRLTSDEDFASAFSAASWGSKAELISQGSFPLRGITAGTYVLRMNFNGTTVDVDLSTYITDGVGSVSNIVRYLNGVVGFNTYGEAFVAGSGDAAQLGIRNKTAGNYLEILTTVSNDCSALLGFTAAKENMYDKGDSMDLLGSFDQYSHDKEG